MTRAALIAEINLYFQDLYTQNISAVGTASKLVDILNSAYIPDSDGVVSSKFKGDWNSATSYFAGDYIYYGLMPYRAINNNTNSIPTTGTDWSLKSVNTNAYSTSWIGSTSPPTQDAMYTQVEALKTFNAAQFVRLDGTSHMAGNLDMNSFNVLNCGNLQLLNGKIYSNGNLNLTLNDVLVSVYALSNAGNNATGNNNVFMGNTAGRNTSGSGLNGYGTQALDGAAGSSLNAFGTYAGMSSNGSENFYAGTSSGSSFNGSNSVFMGPGAGQNGSGNSKLGLGVYAGRLNNDSNVAIFGNFYDIYFNYDMARSSLGSSLTKVTIQTAQAETGTDANASASILNLASARGTGAGLSGNVTFSYSPILASGTTRQTLSLAATMEGITGRFRMEKDLVINNSGTGIVLKDTQATPHYWRITVSTIGTLTTTDLGTSI